MSFMEERGPLQQFVFDSQTAGQSSLSESDTAADVFMRPAAPESQSAGQLCGCPGSRVRPHQLLKGVGGFVGSFSESKSFLGIAIWLFRGFSLWPPLRRLKPGAIYLNAPPLGLRKSLQWSNIGTLAFCARSQPVSNPERSGTASASPRSKKGPVGQSVGAPFGRCSKSDPLQMLPPCACRVNPELSLNLNRIAILALVDIGLGSFTGDAPLDPPASSEVQLPRCQRQAGCGTVDCELRLGHVFLM